jgi:hypothetical protein
MTAHPARDAARRAGVCALLCALALALTGCAAQLRTPAAHHADAGRLATPAVATTQVGVLMTASPAMRAAAGWPAFRSEWRSAFKGATTAAGLRTHFFETEPSENLPGTVLVRITINDYRQVSTGMRWAFGSFTGNAYVDADVEFIELPTKRSLGSRRYSTSSSAWEGMFSAMTNKQIAALAGAMVGELRVP